MGFGLKVQLSQSKTSFWRRGCQAQSASVDDRTAASAAADTVRQTIGPRFKSSSGRCCCADCNLQGNREGHPSTRPQCKTSTHTHTHMHSNPLRNEQVIIVRLHYMHAGNLSLSSHSAAHILHTNPCFFKNTLPLMHTINHNAVNIYATQFN